jgi:hypothetical protein
MQWQRIDLSYRNKNTVTWVSRNMFEPEKPLSPIYQFVKPGNTVKLYFLQTVIANGESGGIIIKII